MIRKVRSDLKSLKALVKALTSPFKPKRPSRQWENSVEVSLDRRDGWPLFKTQGRKVPERLRALTSTENSGALDQDSSISPFERFYMLSGSDILF